LCLLEPIAIERKDRRSSMEQLLDQGKKRLDDERWLVIFPQGTRVAPGEKIQFKRGGALLAEATGYPVVPVAINSGEFWPRHGFLKKSGTIHVIIGPVIESKNRTHQ